MRRQSIFAFPLLAIAAAIPVVAWSAPARHSGPLRILTLHWYDRNYGLEERLDQALQTALESSAPEGIEYYSEYLETNKFPDDKHPELLARYLQQKYADRPLDVVVAGTHVTLQFLLKNRPGLFA